VQSLVTLTPGQPPRQPPRQHGSWRRKARDQGWYLFACQVGLLNLFS